VQRSRERGVKSKIGGRGTEGMNEMKKRKKKI